MKYWLLASQMMEYAPYNGIAGTRAKTNCQ